jgi:hypothetical protein
MLGARVQFHWIPNKHREPELLVLVLLLLPHCVLQRHRHLFSYLLFSSHTKKEAAVPHPNSSLNTHPLPFSLAEARLIRSTTERKSTPKPYRNHSFLVKHAAVVNATTTS